MRSMVEGRAAGAVSLADRTTPSSRRPLHHSLRERSPSPS
jgi:hypothetical protein